MLKPVRKPRPFAGARGAGLKELYSAVFSTLGISKVSPIVHEYNNRYNTRAVAATNLSEANVVTSSIEVLYNRQDLTKVLKMAGFGPVAEGGANELIHADVPNVLHPLTPVKLIGLLNGVFKCDFNEDDLEITVTNKAYSLTAKADSLGYIGTAKITFGGGSTTISCAGAPSSIELELEMLGLPPSLDVGEEVPEEYQMEIKVDGEVIYKGLPESPDFYEALASAGLTAVFPPVVIQPAP